MADRSAAEALSAEEALDWLRAAYPGIAEQFEMRRAEAMALDRERAAALPTLEVERLRAMLQAKRGYPMTAFVGGQPTDTVRWQPEPTGAYVGFEDAWDVVRAAIAQEGSPVGLEVARLRAALRRLASWDEMAGNGDPDEFPEMYRAEVRARIKHARVALRLSDDVSPGPETE